MLYQIKMPVQSRKHRKKIQRCQGSRGLTLCTLHWSFHNHFVQQSRKIYKSWRKSTKPLHKAEKQLPPTTPEYWPKIMISHVSHLDYMSLRKQYEKSLTRLIYMTWLQTIRIPELLMKDSITLQDPAAFYTIPKGPFTTFIIQEWEKFNEQIDTTFDRALQYVNK